MMQAGLYNKFNDNAALLQDFKKYLTVTLKVQNCQQEVTFSRTRAPKSINVLHTSIQMSWLRCYFFFFFITIQRLIMSLGSCVICSPQRMSQLWIS